ncbi:hypothetical protein N9164_14760, partial [Draconibacterium sp.]|nr:hypothetical protein [Draconibacterium sp.]
MKSKNIAISSLSEDIKQIITKTYDNKFNILTFCYDNDTPVVSYDNQPVLDIHQDDLAGIFDLKSNHIFLSVEQTFRLGLKCNLNMTEIIALMLKAEWEEFLFDQNENQQNLET